MSVRHAVLALLSEGPKYGLQLRHEFEARTGEVWPLNVGQVYTTLQRLERDGLVEFNDRSRTRVRPLTTTDFGEICSMRMALESMAARLYSNKTFLAGITRLLTKLTDKHTERMATLGLSS